MLGLHKRDIQKLQDQLSEAKAEYNTWLDRQKNQTSDWHSQRDELNSKIESLKTQINDIKKKDQATENKLINDNNGKGIQIARLKGLIEQLEKKVNSLHSTTQVQAGNV